MEHSSKLCQASFNWTGIYTSDIIQEFFYLKPYEYVLYI